MIKLGVFVPSQSESLLGLFIQSKAEDATPIGSENKERLGSLGSVPSLQHSMTIDWGHKE